MRGFASFLLCSLSAGRATVVVAAANQTDLQTDCGDHESTGATRVSSKEIRHPRRSELVRAAQIENDDEAHQAPETNELPVVELRSSTISVNLTRRPATASAEGADIARASTGTNRASVELMVSPSAVELRVSPSESPESPESPAESGGSATSKHHWTGWESPWVISGLVICGLAVILLISNYIFMDPPDQKPGRAKVTWLSNLVAGLFLLIFAALTAWSVATPWIFNKNNELWLRNNIITLWVCNGFFIVALLHINMSVCGAIGNIWRYGSADSTDYYQIYLDTPGPKKEWNAVQHIVILPNYMEPTDMVLRTLANIAACSPNGFARAQIYVVLAIEEREGDAGAARAEALRQQFDSQFAKVLVSVHPSDIEGETAGKGSNFVHALRVVASLITDPSSCIVHVADSDSMFHQRYFSAVNADFCIRQDDAVCYQPMVIQGCLNIWSVPAFSRLSSISATVDLIDPPLPHSTFSYPYSRLQRIGKGDASLAQDADVMCEDFHLFLNGILEDPTLDIKVIPLPLMNYAVGNSKPSYWDNQVDKFNQAKRWMFGLAAETCYILDSLLVSRSNWSLRSCRVTLSMVAMCFINISVGILVPAGGIITIRAYFPLTEGDRESAYFMQAIIESNAALVYRICTFWLFGSFFVTVASLTTLYGAIDAELYRVKNIEGNQPEYVPRKTSTAFIFFLRLIVELALLMLVTNLIFMLLPLTWSFFMLMLTDHRYMSFVVTPKTLLSARQSIVRENPQDL